MITIDLLFYVFLGRICPICLELVPLQEYNLKQLVQTKCGHVFCEPHILEHLKYKLECPICKTPITKNDIEPLPGLGKSLK